MIGSLIINRGLQLFWGLLCLPAEAQTIHSNIQGFKMSSTLRDSLRAQVFAAQPKKVLVTMGDQVIEVRQPLVGDMIDSMTATDQRQRMVRMMVNSCYVPDTNEKVFEEADYDSILQLPNGGVYSDLMTAITDLIDAKKQEDAAKK